LNLTVQKVGLGFEMRNFMKFAELYKKSSAPSQKRIGFLTLLISILSATATICANADVSPCERRESFHRLGRQILIQAKAEAIARRIPDRRILVKDLTTNPGPGSLLDGFGVNALKEIGRAHVRISGATKDGQQLNEGFGTGFVYGDKCHVLTVRHNVNKGHFIEEYGQTKPVMDEDHDPINATVDVTHGLAGDGPIANTGTVVARGTLDDNFDWAIIRLKSPAPISKVPKVIRRTEVQLIGAPMAGFGLHRDFQTSFANPEVVVDSNCKGLGQDKLLFATNCLAASGGSGGGMASLVTDSKLGSSEWGIIGMAITVDNALASSPGKKSFGYGETKVLRLGTIKSTLDLAVQDDNKGNPCAN
jgi:hypothetical protein